VSRVSSRHVSFHRVARGRTQPRELILLLMFHLISDCHVVLASSMKQVAPTSKLMSKWPKPNPAGTSTSPVSTSFSILTLHHSLLEGSTIDLIHDEACDGSFKSLAKGVPIQMLIYFSSTLRDDYEQQRTQVTQKPCDCRQRWIHGGQSHQGACPGYITVPPKNPEVLRILGGDLTSHRDILQWMKTCCTGGSLVPLKSVISSPLRRILAMTSIEILGVERLTHELEPLFNRLQKELLDGETVSKVFASGDHVLPQIREAICACLAGNFFAGKLNNVDKWMNLARMNRRFDEGVRGFLVGTGDPEVVDVWDTKNNQKYPGMRKKIAAPQPSPARPCPTCSHSEPQSIPYPNQAVQGYSAPYPISSQPIPVPIAQHPYQYSSPPQGPYPGFPYPQYHQPHSHPTQWSSLPRSLSQSISPRTVTKQVRFDDTPTIYPAPSYPEPASHEASPWQGHLPHTTTAPYPGHEHHGPHSPGFGGQPMPQDQFLRGQPYQYGHAYGPSSADPYGHGGIRWG
jgi:hypothetical protein